MKFMSSNRSPATAAAGSGVLIVTALVGVVLVAGNAGGPATSATAASAPASVNGAPMVLPSACPAVRLRQPCDAAVVRPRHNKARGHPTQPVVAPTPTAVTPTNPAQP